MVEAVKQPDAPAGAKRELTPEEAEREVARRYQVLQSESSALVSRVMEIEDEKKEYE